MLFGANKEIFGNALAESSIALIIFTIDAGSYLVFVFCTIGQITKFLDIYCLSIKHNKTNMTAESLGISSEVESKEAEPEKPPKPMNRADRRKNKGKE